MGDGKKKDDCVKLAEYHFVDRFYFFKKKATITIFCFSMTPHGSGFRFIPSNIK